MRKDVVEISNAQFDFTGDYVATCSLDRTCKLWDPRKPGSAVTFYGHKDEVFDIAFNSTGTKQASVSADGTGRIYNVADSATSIYDQKDFYVLHKK